MDVDHLLSSALSGSSIDIEKVFTDKREEYGLSKTKALRLLNIDKDVFDDIINGKAKQPNLIHIIKIAEFTEIHIDTFIKAIMQNQSPSNMAALESARNATFIVKHFDVKALEKLGFFKSGFSSEELIQKVLDYFGYTSIAEYEEQLEDPLFSRVKKKHSEKMTDFWVKSAYQTFKIINNPNEYDREELKEIIIKIKPYCQDVKSGLLTVCRALYNVGVTVIFQNYLPITQVRGATFLIDRKPSIVITDYNKSYPTLWFTLLHELNHVLFDLETIERSTYHLSDDRDLFLIEDQANDFARDFFLSEDKFHYVKRFINNPFLVRRFAMDNEIHPSMIYSFNAWYQKELYGKNFFGAFKDQYPDYKDAVGSLNPITWNEESIYEASEKIKSVLELH